MRFITTHAAWLAAASWLLALVAFGAAVDGYSHAQHPVALLGARGMAHAIAFNVGAFVIPGVLAAVAAMELRGRLPGNAGWLARIGARLLWLSALAFAAQGLLPLDPADLDGNRSQWHATAWTLWWIAADAGALLAAVGLLRLPGWRGLAWAALAASVVIVVCSLSPPGPWPAGVAQRLAFATWMALLILAGRAPSGRAALQP